MTRQQRYQYLLDYFRRQMPHVTTELHFGSAFQLLCATVLSAQCTDKRVNMVTPALFAAYPTAQAMSQATADELLAYVSSVSYPNSKARHLAFDGRRAGQAARSGAQDGQRHASRMVRKGGNGGRHPRLSSEPSHGTRAQDSRQSAEGREVSHGSYTCRRYSRCPSLAAATWQICVPEPASAMQRVCFRRHLPQTYRGQQA